MRILRSVRWAARRRETSCRCILPGRRIAGFEPYIRKLQIENKSDHYVEYVEVRATRSVASLAVMLIDPIMEAVLDPQRRGIGSCAIHVTQVAL